MNVLKRVMDKSPELITHDLPSWIAFHSLDRNSSYYRPVLEEAFKYLTSFATQSVLEKALSIVKRNEHYKSTRMATLKLCVASPRTIFLRIFLTKSMLFWNL